MATPSLTKFGEQFDALRIRYAENLPNRIAEMEAVWERLHSAEWVESGYRDLYRSVHSLVGSSGTYGYRTVSLAARALETCMKTHLGSTHAPSDEQCARIDGLFEALKLVPAELTLQTSPDVGASQKSALNQRAEKRTVFFLMPDRQLGEEMAAQVSHFGYTVRTFVRSSDLQAAIKDSAPAAIVLDSPEADLLSKLRAQTELPIMLISTHDDLHARLAAVRAGAAAYLIKPIDVSDLAEQLDLLTEQRVAEPFRILIVDDSAETAEFLAANLTRAGLSTFVLNDPLQIIRPLRDFNPDLILMDLYMPGCDGLELAAVIRQQNEYLSIPIVFLSTETDLNKQLAAMRLGGDEFLTKPIEPFHLVSAVVSRSQRSRVLRSLMVRDSLTGLLNHTATEERLGIEVARAERQESRLAFAMIDLDRFKQINDTYGHQVGDHVLKSLSRVLQQRLRKTDVIGRYGGEEFAVILPDTDGRNAARVLDEIRTSFAQIQHVSAGTEFFVTFSCGVAVFPQYLDAVQLNDAADHAMYQAKELGRNRVVLVDGQSIMEFGAAE